MLKQDMISWIQFQIAEIKMKNMSFIVKSVTEF